LKTLVRRFVNARSAATAVVQTAVASVAVQGVNIASGVLIARTLGPSGRGALTAIIMWPQFLAYGLSFGIPVASVYWLKRRPEEANRLAGAAFVLSLVLGVAAAIVGFFIIPHSLHTYTSTQIRFAQKLVVVTPLALLAVTIVAFVQSAGSFRTFNLFRFFSPVSVLIVLLLERASNHLNATSAAIAYLLSATPATVLIAIWVWRHYKPKFRGVLGASKLLLGYGVRAWGGDLLGTIASQIDRILIVGMLNPEMMGLYVVAQSAAGVLAVLPTAVSPVTLPKSSGLGTEAIIELTGRAVRVTLFVMIIAALPLWFCGGLLIKLVYGAKFLRSASILPFLVAEAILDGMTSVLSQAFLAAGFPGTVSLLQGTGLITSIPLLYWFIPRFGARGAALALTLATSMRFVFILLSFPYRLKVKPPSLLIRRQELTSLFWRLRGMAPAPKSGE
jgi:O-antigen/teichoic acid export membrane protein